MYSIQPINNIVCELGECPVWDPFRQCLFYTDVLKSRLYSYIPSTGVSRCFITPPYPGSMVLCKDKRLLLGTAEGLFFFNPETAHWQFHTRGGLPHGAYRFNDATCDADGNLITGIMHLQERPGCGSLVKINARGISQTILTGLTIPNGTVLLPDRPEFYFIDSAAGSVRLFQYDEADGSAIEKKIIVQLNKEEGVPDGMAVDNDGGIWVAHFGGGNSVRYNPANGERLSEIKVPALQVTSCCFGGKDLTDLYITTAARDMDTANSNMQDGRTFLVSHTGHRPAPVYTYG
jgi:sugar lactone lactonase YvrE